MVVEVVQPRPDGTPELEDIEAVMSRFENVELKFNEFDEESEESVERHEGSGVLFVTNLCVSTHRGVHEPLIHTGF